MDAAWLEGDLDRAGFSVTVMTGRFHTSGAWWKESAKAVLNDSIALMGKRGLAFAACYGMYANSIY